MGAGDCPIGEPVLACRLVPSKDVCTTMYAQIGVSNATSRKESETRDPQQSSIEPKAYSKS